MRAASRMLIFCTFPCKQIGCCYRTSLSLYESSLGICQMNEPEQKWISKQTYIHNYSRRCDLNQPENLNSPYIPLLMHALFLFLDNEKGEASLVLILSVVWKSFHMAVYLVNITSRLCETSSKTAGGILEHPRIHLLPGWSGTCRTCLSACNFYIVHRVAGSLFSNEAETVVHSKPSRP